MNISKDEIHFARRKAGLNQRELAQLLGVSESTVGQWETGRRNPTGVALKSLAQWLTGKNVGERIDREIDREISREIDLGIDGRLASATDFPATPANEMQSLLQIIRDQQAMMERQRADGALMMERHHAVIQEQQAMAERQRQDVARLTEVLSRQQELFAELVRSKSVPGADPAMDRIREIDRKNAHGRPLKEVIGESSQDKQP